MKNKLKLKLLHYSKKIKKLPPPRINPVVFKREDDDEGDVGETVIFSLQLLPTKISN